MYINNKLTYFQITVMVLTKVLKKPVWAILPTLLITLRPLWGLLVAILITAILMDISLRPLCAMNTVIPIGKDYKDEIEIPVPM